jgi:hypothetical protein
LRIATELVQLTENTRKNSGRISCHGLLNRFITIFTVRLSLVEIFHFIASE